MCRSAGRAVAGRPRGAAVPGCPAPSHRRRRHAAEPLRHQHRWHARRSPPCKCATGRRSGRGPHPRHQRAQPSPPRRQAESNLARKRPDRPLLLTWVPIPAPTGCARLRAPRRLPLRRFSTPLTWSPPHPPTRQALALVRTDHRRPGPAPEPLEPPIDKYLSSPTSSTAPTEPPDTENPYKLSVQRGFRESGGPSEPSLPRPRHSNKGLHRTLTLWQHDKSQRMQDRPVLKCVALLLTRRMTDSELSEQTGISSRVRTALRGVPSINGG